MVWNVQGFVNDEQGLIVLVAELVLKNKTLACAYFIRVRYSIGRADQR